MGRVCTRAGKGAGLYQDSERAGLYLVRRGRAVPRQGRGWAVPGSKDAGLYLGRERGGGGFT